VNVIIIPTAPIKRTIINDNCKKKYKLKELPSEIKIISRNNIKESCKKPHVVIFRFLYSRSLMSFGYLCWN
jgi:hypothetical protein